MSKLKLITFSVEKKYLWPARMIMLLAASPFIFDIYHAFNLGVIHDGAVTAIYSERKALFFSSVFKKTCFILFFMWLCVGGIVEKKNQRRMKVQKIRIAMPNRL